MAAIKLFVIGHGRHGKDTVSEMLVDKLNLSMRSSSEIACELFIYDKLKHVHGYTHVDACFNDRHNHRREWHDLIAEYNADNPTRLAEVIFSRYDIYCGIRNRREFDAAISKQLANDVIYVGAHDRLPEESPESMQLNINDATIYIDNNKDLFHLEQQVDHISNYLRNKYTTASIAR